MQSRRREGDNHELEKVTGSGLALRGSLFPSSVQKHSFSGHFFLAGFNANYSLSRSSSLLCLAV